MIRAYFERLYLKMSAWLINEMREDRDVSYREYRKAVDKYNSDVEFFKNRKQ